MIREHVLISQILTRPWRVSKTNHGAPLPTVATPLCSIRLETHSSTVLCAKSATACEEFQATRDPSKADNAFKKWVAGAKVKQCPFCKFWVEKSQGCDHMRCRCGKEFCYRCGGVYRQCACVAGGRI
ncbi:hypothetical protein FGO68_gene2248 [Halteria grandinella]|uniref:RING-type domain-containing protein n=1 Tax=Halteria grandinella TaxID=5974 RepID=A0A8J8T198_HALGN|nr:hypothetical protein FGO68_gene2248 [Halteria grandinella]